MLPQSLFVLCGPLLVLGHPKKHVQTFEIVPDDAQKFRPGSPGGKQDCNLQCPRTLDYHCGTDGKTYKNPCYLLNANCENHDIKLGYKGQCSRDKPIPPSSCPKTWSCIGQYQPVCGTDDKTYDNNCYLVIANCRDTSIGFKHYGACEDGGTVIKCQRRCSHYPMQPVCGSDNIIYRNVCELKNARCNPNKYHLIQVTCPSTGKTKCSGVCNLDYDPKCGSNGETYINKCHMDLNTCRDYKITLAYDGPCTAPVETRCTKCSGDEEEDYVCGSDGKSYRSACDFNYALCKQPCPTTLNIESSGRCQCDEDCSFAKYDPVCGTDGETYATACAFRVASCNKLSIKLQATGECV